MLKGSFVTAAERAVRQRAAEDRRQAQEDRQALLDDMIAEHAARRAGEAGAPASIRRAAQRQMSRGGDDPPAGRRPIR